MFIVAEFDVFNLTMSLEYFTYYYRSIDPVLSYANSIQTEALTLKYQWLKV
jgi:hypothetical protein